MNSSELLALVPILLLLGLGIVGACIFVARRRSGEPPVVPVGRRPVPWDGPLVVAAILLYLLCTQVVAAFLLGDFYRLRDPVRPIPESLADAHDNSAFVIAMFQAHAVTSYLALAAVMLLLHRAVGATTTDLGFATADGRRLVKIGLAAFAIVVPPVIILQGILEALWMKSQHVIIMAYRATGDPALFFWSSIAAVAVAPIVEEFFFRGVLQGWLERRFALPGDAADAPTPADDAAAVLPAGDEDFASATTIPSAVGPVVLSAALFAVVHHEAGPDVVPIFFLGLGLGYLYRQTHSLWPGIVTHALLNAWSMGALYVSQRIG